MAFLLGALYEKEQELSKQLLDDLLQGCSRSSPSIRTKRRLPRSKIGCRKKQRDISSIPAQKSPSEYRTERDLHGNAEVQKNRAITYNGYETICAFGVSCRLRDHVGGQDPSRITAVCQQCKVAKMHDLCGGGED